MSTLENKKILIIAPEFFDYDFDIEKELRRRGADIYRLLDRPFQNIIFKLLCNLCPNIISYFLIPYYYLKIRKFKKSVDFIYVINGQTLHRFFLKYIKELYNPKLMILYMWDSMENRPNALRCLSFYDRVLSFDPKSCREYSMEFRPLFFVPKHREKAKFDYKYDLAFVGTAHSDRYEIMSALKKSNSDKQIYSYLFLQSKIVYLIRRYIFSKYKGATIRDFYYVPLKQSEVREIISDSYILLDIEHQRQKGLTIRCIDYINHNKKIITTNEEIKNYDFYLTGNILVIDRQNPIIPDRFWNQSFKPYADDLLYRYSIEAFINDCFGLNI